jgi:hypothetical protein
MPIHDWSEVQAGIFHHFHHGWIDHIAAALNQGLLPSDHYALAEQIAGGLGPDVLTLQVPANGASFPHSAPGGVALAVAPPKVWHRARTQLDMYANKAKAVVIRHAGDHRIIAVVEIVSPGNKSSRNGIRKFVEKAVELLRAGIHLLVIDLLPPSSRDPQGMHKAIWDELNENEFMLPPGKPLTLAAYMGGPLPETFVEAVSVGSTLVDMPIFLNEDFYVPAPLEATYQAARQGVPAYWQKVIAKQMAAN